MGSVGCTEDLGFCPEGSGEARRVFLIIVANYSVEGEITAMSSLGQGGHQVGRKHVGDQPSYDKNQDC